MNYHFMGANKNCDQQLKQRTVFFYLKHAAWQITTEGKSTAKPMCALHYAQFHH